MRGGWNILLLREGGGERDEGIWKFKRSQKTIDNDNNDNSNSDNNDNDNDNDNKNRMLKDLEYLRTLLKFHLYLDTWWTRNVSDSFFQ